MSSSTPKSALYIPHSGPSLLETPLLNKGSAFTAQERVAFNLTGLIPPRYESIEEQVERAYMQYSSFNEPINKHIYLRAIQDNNETLYYRLIQQHIDEMMPIIYTPTVGDACEQLSDLYQGIGGMGIPIGKLSLYTACGGISPAYTLPVMLDVGTNNEKLLNDPMYMGARHKRIGQAEYDEFVDMFIKAVLKRWPEVMLQFEDFAQPNAMPLLERYRDKVCCFNDDIQGTAAVTVGTILAACKSKGNKLSEQRVVFVGAGSAGCGIAEQIIKQMTSEGISDAQARRQVFMVDRFGLVTDDMQGLRDFQLRLAQPLVGQENWPKVAQYPSLLETVSQVKPSILIGVSGQAGLFTEQVIKEMKSHCDLPIIFPLSNPSRQVEARPEQVIEWTDGKVIIATGSPFKPVEYNGKTYPIAQCNNSYIFPGVGLGVLAAKASLISDEMLMATSAALANASPLANGLGSELLPPLTCIAQLSKKIAFDVGKIAQKQGLALEVSDEVLSERIEGNFWKAEYRPYKRVSI